MGQPFREFAGKLALGTAALAVAACGSVALWSSLDVSLAEGRRARREIPAEEAARIANKWTGLPGLAGPARSMLARVTADAPERPLAEQLSEQRALLASEPSNSEAWLTYAKVALLAGEPDARVADIYRQSFLTGRYEGRLFFDRALFALAAWSIVPDDLRRIALSQLLLGRPLDPQDYQRLRAFLPAIADETRAGFSTTIYELSQSEADRAWLRGLGVYPLGARPNRP